MARSVRKVPGQDMNLNNVSSVLTFIVIFDRLEKPFHICRFYLLIRSQSLCYNPYSEKNKTNHTVDRYEPEEHLTKCYLFKWVTPILSTVGKNKNWASLAITRLWCTSQSNKLLCQILWKMWCNDSVVFIVAVKEHLAKFLLPSMNSVQDVV